MKTRPFKQVDVFTARPYFGNPLAVVLDGSDLDDAAMQRFAQWTNLSETTFVLPPVDPAADYSVRIFTPGGELPFAGHPTLGTCHAWLQAGGQPQRKDCIVQQSQIGLVQVRREGDRLAFAAPPLRRSAPSPAVLAQIAAALNLKAQQITAAQLLDNGPVWLGLLLDGADTVLQIEPDHLALKNIGIKVGVIGAHPAPLAPLLIARANREARAFGGVAAVAEAGIGTKAADFEVRAFAAPLGIQEDPVTGSLNASLGQWLVADGFLPTHYRASQGSCMGRAGQVFVERDADGQVWVGGESVTCIDGTVTL